jgi:predicted amidohydrolase YtcJ
MAEFDIVIHGGRVIDGTGNPWFYGDLGLKNGKIASIGKINPEAGQRAISAKGYVVTPGFIDMHTHSDQPIVADGNAESKIRQGVTLDIIGESQTVAPLEGAILEEYRAEHRKRNGIEIDWQSFTGYFNTVMRGGKRRVSSTKLLKRLLRNPPVCYDCFRRPGKPSILTLRSRRTSMCLLHSRDRVWPRRRASA